MADLVLLKTRTFNGQSFATWQTLGSAKMLADRMRQNPLVESVEIEGEEEVSRG